MKKLERPSIHFVDYESAAVSVWSFREGCRWTQLGPVSAALADYSGEAVEEPLPRVTLARASVQLERFAILRSVLESG